MPGVCGRLERSTPCIGSGKIVCEVTGPICDDIGDGCNACSTDVDGKELSLPFPDWVQKCGAGSEIPRADITLPPGDPNGVSTEPPRVDNNNALLGDPKGVSMEPDQWQWPTETEPADDSRS